MTTSKINITSKLPDYSSGGYLYYLWTHIYDRASPKLTSFVLRKPENNLGQLFDFYAVDDIPYTIVFTQISERKPHSYTEYTRKGVHTKKQAGGQIHPTYVYDLTPTIRVHATETDECISVTLAGEYGDDFDDIIKWFNAKFPKLPDVDDEVPFEFTFMGEYGADSHDRNISAPTWESIRANYPGKAATELDKLIAFTPSEDVAGKLGILAGPPGTGKTHVLRALSRSWKEWATFKYIMDAEKFFKDPSYMLDVLLRTSDEGKWNVIICEDAEEYIAPDSKARIGQALSRLLNTGDGLIGQGLRIIILFTTNAPDAKLHEAITRPGRCFFRINIPLLSHAESLQWLNEHNVKDRAVTDTSLAVLYQMMKDEKQIVSEEDTSLNGQYL